MDTTTAGMLRFAGEQGGQVGGTSAEFNSLLEPTGPSSGASGGSAAAAMMLVMAEAFAMEWNDTFVAATTTESLNETYQDNNSTAGGDNEPQFYSPLYRIIGTFFQGIIFLVGVLGNVMVVYVVAKSKAMRSPTNCYLVSLAIADCITLIASVPQEILSYYLVGNKWIWGSIGCAGFIYFQNVSINASALSLTAFTIERYIAICHPMRAHSVCTVRRAKKILIGVWIFAVCYCSPWLFLTTTIPLEYEGYNESVQCVHKVNRKNDIYIAYYMADLVTFYVIPLILSTILYTRIARTLFLSNRATRSQEYNAPGNQQQLTAAPTASKSHSSRVQVIKMLVMVVVIFAILWLPYRGLLVYNSFMSPPFMNLWFLMLAKTCIFINSAINPILYNAMSIKFRTEFSRTLRCWKRTGSHKNGTTFRSRLGTSTTMTHLPSPMTGTYHENTSLSSSSSHGDATEGLNSHHRKRSSRKHPYSMTSAAQRTSSRGKSRTAETSAPGGHLQIYTSVGAGTSVVNCNSIPFSVHDNVTQL